MGLGLLLWGQVAWAVAEALSRPFPGVRVGWCATVSETNDPSWVGIRAGLRPGDLITRLDQVWVYTGPELAYGLTTLKPKATYSLEAIGASHARPLRVRQAALPLPAAEALRHFGPDFLLDLLLLASGAFLVWRHPFSPSAWACFALMWALGASLILGLDYDLSYSLPAATLFAVQFMVGSSVFALAIHFPSPPSWLLGRPGLRTLPWWGGGLLAAGVMATFVWQGPSPHAEGLATGLVILWTTLALSLGVGTFVRRRGRALAAVRREMNLVLGAMMLAFWPALAVQEWPMLLWDSPAPSWWTHLAHAMWFLFPLAMALGLRGTELQEGSDLVA